jgi:predicted aconitase with swiveling domain
VIVEAKALVRGGASGPIVAVPPLSFWGGYDPASGKVIDRTHPAFGKSLSGCVVTMPSGRGSSSSSSVLAEAIRLGTAPAAIILSDPDPILAVGAMVAETLYRRSCPILLVSAADQAAIADYASAEIAPSAGALARIHLTRA